MAKIQAGILSNVRGAVAGVVGGVWKGKNYLRARVTPANPNTAAQQAQRTKMSATVAFAKLILGTVLNVFVDPFQKVMSGFNWFVKNNIAYFTETPTWSSMKLTEGTLFGAVGTSAVIVDGQVVVDFDDALGTNGEATDMVTYAFRRESTGKVYTLGTPVARSAGTATLNIAGILATETGQAWIITYREVAGVLTMVSNSEYIAVTATE